MPGFAVRAPATPAQRAADPADVLVAWEAVEELLAAVPDGPVKEAWRLTAAGLSPVDIAERLAVPVDEIGTLLARGRVRVLTAALSRRPRSREPR